MAKAGFTCLIRRNGVSTTVSGEVCTLVTGNTYQISTAARRALDPNAAYNFKDDAATVAYSDISSLNWEFGEVTFATAKTGTVTFSGSFYPLTTTAEVVTEAVSFSLSENSELLDSTVFTSTSNLRKRFTGLADAEATVDLLANTTDLPRLATLQFTGAVCMLEINSGFSALFRGYGLIESLERSAAVDGRVEATLTWKLSAQRDANTGLIAGYSIRNLTS